MRPTPRALITGLWLSWAVYWWIAARGVKRNQWRESTLSRMVHGLPLVAAFLLLSPTNSPSLTGASAAARICAWIGMTSTAAGLGFAVWARRHIGRNWSGVITVKEDHELVTSGPYSLVRHPIYSGLLLAFAGSALASMHWRGAAALALATMAIMLRVRGEEVVMRGRFGEDYLRYAARVAPLVPFLGGRRPRPGRPRVL